MITIGFPLGGELLISSWTVLDETSSNHMMIFEIAPLIGRVISSIPITL
jgi:hypothetical protein